MQRVDPELRERGRAPSCHSSPGSSQCILRNLKELTIAKLSWLGIRTCFTSVLSFSGKGYCKQAGEKESVKEDCFPSVSYRHPSQTNESQEGMCYSYNRKQPESV